MTYRATSDSSSQTPQERTDEAKRILFELGLATKVEDMTGSSERSFVYDQADRLSNDPNAPISVKQLWWLRDLKEKYLD